MRSCTGSTSQNASSRPTSWESQCIAVCRTRLLSTWSTTVHQSQTFPAASFTVNHSTLPDRTTLPAQHFRSFCLLCGRRWSDGLKLATGQSPRPGAQQQQLQRIANDESILSLQLTTPEAHSTVEMLHESALYKSIINTDIDIDLDK